MHECDINGADMTDEQLLKAQEVVIKLANVNRVSVIGITGGEPMLHPDIKDIFEYLKYVNVASNRTIKFDLHTNGSVFPKNINPNDYINLFDDIFIGNDIFHDKFRKNRKNQIKVNKLSKLGTMTIRNPIYSIEDKEVVVVKDKGRATNLLQYSIPQMTNPTCMYAQNGGRGGPSINFNPDNISFCCDASHLDPSYNSNIGYDASVDEIIEAAIKYRYTSCQDSCEHPCKLLGIDIYKYNKGIKNGELY